MSRSGSYVVLDFETTGLSPRHAEIVESGAVQVDGGRIGESFHALSRPTRPIPASVTAIHGISDETVAAEPPFGEVLPSLLAFLGDRVLVAHHARFDCSFLDAATQRAGLHRPGNAILDTVRLSRRLFPHLDRHDLGSLCITHRIRRPRAHRALDDALATAELLGILLDRAEEEGMPREEVLLAGRPGSWRRPRGPARITLDPEEMERLRDAAITGDLLGLGYVSARGAQRRADVVPYRIDAAGAAPRLIAYDVAAGRTRIWPLERVTGVGEAGGEA